jgi:hypothetical protein
MHVSAGGHLPAALFTTRHLLLTCYLQACMQYVRAIHALGPPSAPKPPTALLGPTYPPSWVDAYPNRTHAGSIMSRIFGSVNRAAGITCSGSARGGKAREAGGAGRGDEHATKGDAAKGEHAMKGEYTLTNTGGLLGPVDRYNIVGHRKPDRIHPMPNAQRAVLLMMTRHICPN